MVDQRVDDAHLEAVSSTAASAGLNAAGEVERLDIAFAIAHLGEGGLSRTVRGSLYLPPGTRTPVGVVVLLHGFSYGAWVWDLPDRPDYSTARYLAAGGHPVVTVDQLGYGSSDRPNGYTISVEGLGDIARQVASQLRGGTYQADRTPAFPRVCLAGHSAGGEVARYEAGTFGDVDALIVMSMGNAATPESSQAFVDHVVPICATSDYVAPFFGSDERRLEFFYRADEADPEIIGADRRLANAVPSGELASVAAGPSAAVVGDIAVPVLLVFAEADAVVPVAEAQTEPARYERATSVTTLVVAGAGHTFPLHRNRQRAFDGIAAWLDEHLDAPADSGLTT